MLAELQRTTPEESKEQRIALGTWLKSLREGRGLSQRDLAELLSLDYYTFISQLETGRGKIPEQRYVQWAEALGQDPKHFVQVLLKHYHPVTYKVLYDDDSAT
jgi:transcriptional regulator with XRE-family HTH domain